MSNEQHDIDQLFKREFEDKTQMPYDTAKEAIFEKLNLLEDVDDTPTVKTSKFNWLYPVLVTSVALNVILLCRLFLLENDTILIENENSGTFVDSVILYEEVKESVQLQDTLTSKLNIDSLQPIINDGTSRTKIPTIAVNSSSDNKSDKDSVITITTPDVDKSNIDTVKVAPYNEDVKIDRSVDKFYNRLKAQQDSSDTLF